MTLTLPITLPPTGDTKNSRIRTQLFDIQNYLNSGAIGIVGTTTNDSAAAGDIGEYKESIVANISAPTSGHYGDMTSISLTAGDWDVSAICVISNNGATLTGPNVLFFGTTSGDNNTDSVVGDNTIYMVSSSAYSWGGSIPPKRVSLSGSATYYLKFGATYTVATPKFYGRIYARRAR